MKDTAVVQNRYVKQETHVCHICTGCACEGLIVSTCRWQVNRQLHIGQPYCLQSLSKLHQSAGLAVLEFVIIKIDMQFHELMTYGSTTGGFAAHNATGQLCAVWICQLQWDVNVFKICMMCRSYLPGLLQGASVVYPRNSLIRVAEHEAVIQM